METTSTPHTEILNAALALPPASRRQLAEQILGSIPSKGLSEGDPDFFEELDRRFEALRSGEDPGIDHDEFMKEMRAKIHSTIDSRSE